MPIRAVLLDLDDTILDENPGRAAARQLVMDTLAHHHPSLLPATIGALLDQTNERFWSDPDRHAWGRKNMFAARGQVLAELFSQLNLVDSALRETLLARYMALRDAQMVFCPGAQFALQQLRRRYPKLGLLTNGGGTAQRAKITRFQLGTCFDHIQVEEEFGIGKPDPAAFLNLLSKLNVDPESAVMVGNDWQADILPALQLHLRTVHIAQPTANHLPPGCHRVANLGQVPAILENGTP